MVRERRARVGGGVLLPVVAVVLFLLLLLLPTPPPPLSSPGGGVKGAIKLKRQIDRCRRMAPAASSARGRRESKSCGIIGRAGNNNYKGGRRQRRGQEAITPSSLPMSGPWDRAMASNFFFLALSSTGRHPGQCAVSSTKPPEHEPCIWTRPRLMLCMHGPVCCRLQSTPLDKVPSPSPHRAAALFPGQLPLFFSQSRYIPNVGSTLFGISRRCEKNKKRGRGGGA